VNPGGLYGQARPENFPHVNDYRNSVVAEMMKNLNYVNMFNHGVSEVQDLLKRKGGKKNGEWIVAIDIDFSNDIE
jgi:ATP-dependent DNA helicase RecG